MFNKGLFVGLLLSLFVGNAFAESNIAFVNGSKVIRSSTQIKMLKEAIDKEFSGRSAELISSKKQLKKLEDKKRTDASTMGEAELSRLSDDIKKRRRDIIRTQRDFTADRSLRSREKMRVLNDLVNSAIKTVAIKRKVDIVLETVVWASPKIDITDDVIKELKTR